MKSYKEKLSDLIKSLDVLLTDVQRVEAQEAHLARKGEIILQKEKGLARREVVLAEGKSKVEVLNEEQKNLIKAREEKEKDLGKVAERVEEKKKGLIAKGKIIDGKVSELSGLEETKKELDEREKELIKEKAEIIEKESLIKKEKMLARKRKEALDVRDRTLKAKQAKLQKFLDLSESI